MSFQENKRRERELKREMMEQDRRIARQNLDRREAGEPTLINASEYVSKSRAPKREDAVSQDGPSVKAKSAAVEPAIKVSISISPPMAPLNVYTRKGLLNGANPVPAESEPSTEEPISE